MITQHLDLRQRLRLETRSDHEALDQAVDLIGRPPDFAQYRSLLTRLYGLHSRIEPVLALVLPPSLIAHRSRLDALRHDLVGCGIAPDTFHTIAPIDRLPVIANRAAALGVFYVMEGSTLGGQIIARHLATNPAIPTGTYLYFKAYGDHTGLRWRDACEALNAMSDPDSDDECVSTAREMFTCLRHWLALEDTDGGRDRD